MGEAVMRAVLLLLAATASVAPAAPANRGTHTALPVSQLSAKYRNWTYVNGPYEGFVVPPTAGNFTGQNEVDTPALYEKTAEDTLPGKYRMSYLFYRNIKGDY